MINFNGLSFKPALSFMAILLNNKAPDLCLPYLVVSGYLFSRVFYMMDGSIRGSADTVSMVVGPLTSELSRCCGGCRVSSTGLYIRMFGVLMAFAKM